MPGQRIICWDIDATLGLFKIPSGWEKESSKPPAIGIRAGLHGLLKELISENYVHVATTYGEEEHQTQVLQKAGLLPYFSRVFGRETIQKPRSKMLYKCYQPVLSHFGINTSYAKEHMLVIGDEGWDLPCDLQGVVFLQQFSCYAYHAKVTRIIIDMLLNAGKGSFFKGFQSIYQSSAPHPVNKQFRHFSPVPDLELLMDYYNNLRKNEGDRTAPIILILAGESFKSEVQPFPESKSLKATS